MGSKTPLRQWVFFGNVYLLALDLKHLKIIVKIGSNYILGFRNLHMHIYLQDVRK